MEREKLSLEKIKVDKNLINFFYKKKILITGHTGFVGSWLTFYFLKLGCKVTGISSKNSNKNNIFNLFKLRSKIKHHSFDLLNLRKLNQITKEKFDIVIHLAARPLVFESLKEPDKYISNNILSTLNLFRSVRNANLFINFTTDKVYKNKNKRNYFYKETDELGGDDPYSFSKTCSDLLTNVWSKLETKKKSNFCNVRSGNIIGGGDWNKKRIMSDLVNLLFLNKNLYIRNMSSTRPWIHVAEVCICLSKLIYRLSKKKYKYSEWNIGPNKNDNKNISWIINSALSITNKKHLKNKVVVLKKKRFREKNYLQLSNSKIKKETKFNFNIKFKDRLSYTIEWYEFFMRKRSELERLMISQINNIYNDSK